MCNDSDSAGGSLPLSLSSSLRSIFMAYYPNDEQVQAQEGTETGNQLARVARSRVSSVGRSGPLLGVLIFPVTNYIVASSTSLVLRWVRDCVTRFRFFSLFCETIDPCFLLRSTPPPSNFPLHAGRGLCPFVSSRRRRGVE